jgi:hypothetical protein
VDNTSPNKAKKLTILDAEIKRFDAILADAQEHLSDYKEDLEVYERIVNVRDSLYRLKAQMRDCVIVEFPAAGTEPDKEDGILAMDLTWFEDDDDENDDSSSTDGYPYSGEFS